MNTVDGQANALRIGAERVECDIDGTAVSLELENLRHNLSSGSASHLRLVEVLMAQAALEVLGERGLDEYTVVKLLNVGSNAKHRHGFKPAQGVASIKELTGIAFVKGACDEKGNIVDHVAVEDEVESRTINGFALGQVVVGCACEKAVAVASDDALDVTVHWG
ncbi:hypothetical protein HG531_010898 [Fusarium graminearum]|nr:hypothetical protein HG531_010898 [Fusarium graminearum]